MGKRIGNAAQDVPDQELAAVHVCHARDEWNEPRHRPEEPADYQCHTAPLLEKSLGAGKGGGLPDAAPARQAVHGQLAGPVAQFRSEDRPERDEPGEIKEVQQPALDEDAAGIHD